MPDSDFRIPRPVKTDSMLLGEIVEPLRMALNTPYEPDPRLADLTAGQRALYAIHWTDFEICNGGFDQYFFNSTGYLAPEFIEGARLVGAFRHAHLMERGVALVGGLERVRDRDSRQTFLLDVMMADQQKEMNLITDEFYSLDRPDSPEQLLDLAQKYLDAHPDEFFR